MKNNLQLNFENSKESTEYEEEKRKINSDWCEMNLKLLANMVCPLLKNRTLI